MSQSEAHPVRKGIIATVVGGIILAAPGVIWSPARSALAWIWAKALAGVAALSASYSVPGWLIVLASIGAVLVAVKFVRSLATAMPVPRHAAYTQDTIFGAVWHWSWNGAQITRLWASCPACHGELVFLEDQDSYLFANPQAKFYCEHCRVVVVEIPGRGRTHAISAVEREIRRRLRVAEQTSAQQAS